MNCVAMNPEYTRIESFNKNGFIVIPDVLSTEEVASLRKIIHDEIRDAPLDKRMLTIGDILKNKDLLAAVARIQFSERLMERLRAIIPGKLCYINDFNLQCNMFGVGLWHTDCSSEVDNRNSYMYGSDYHFGKVGVYLQDNTAEFGGGITVLRSSHKAFKQIPFAKKFSYLYSALLSRAQFYSLRMQTKRAQLLPIQAGSAVYFDSRLLHCSSPPSALVLNEKQRLAQRLDGKLLGEDRAKYVLYWEACATECAEDFLRNSCK